MAKKRKEKDVQAAASPRTRRHGNAVRLDLNDRDFDLLKELAEDLGLTNASFARMAVREKIKRMEEERRNK